jgi:regulatory protein
MKKITAIETQKKNPNRVNIFLDDQFAFGLSRIVAAWLQPQQMLTDEKIAALLNEDAREVAMQKALHFLSYRARSNKEIFENLNKHEIPEDVIWYTIQRLQENNLLNDQEFAKTWVENRNTFRPRSRRVLAMELHRKGLDDEVVQEVLKTNLNENDLSMEAARMYVRKVQGLEWPQFRQKLGGFLGRRGFSYDVCASVTRSLWDEIHSDCELSNINDNEELL